MFNGLKVSPFCTFLVLLVLRMTLLIMLILICSGCGRLRGMFGAFVGKGGKGSLRRSVFRQFSGVSRIMSRMRRGHRRVTRLCGGVEARCRGIKVMGCSTFRRVKNRLDFTVAVLSRGGAK